MKKILNISLTVILIAGALFLLAFTEREYKLKTYKNFRIDILNPSEDALITEHEIRQLIIENLGEIEGVRMTRINLDMIENLARNNPYVSSCEVYQTLDATLVLKCRVRRPLVRIINDDLQQYFIDYQGCLMPVKPQQPAHILIANGRVADRYVSLDKSETSLARYPDSSILRQIYKVALHISEDDFLHSFIDQIYINDHHEIELVPKIGSQIIIFGDATDSREKLQNLKTFYRDVMSKIDWNKYKTINLKYKNQVVCSKTESI